MENKTQQQPFTEMDWTVGDNCHTITAEYEEGYKLICQVEDPAYSFLISQSPAMYRLTKHIAAMADDAYLAGHPEWVEIVKEAMSLIQKANSIKQ